MGRRASAALNLEPTGDRQGNHYFYDIDTNRVVEHLIDKHTPVPMPENIPAKLHKIGLRERMSEGIITDEKDRETNYGEEVIYMMDQEFVPVLTNPIDPMLGNDVESISSSELNNLEIFGKGNESHVNDTHVTQKPAIIESEHDKKDDDYTQIGKQPTIIQFEDIPGEISDVTMTLEDNDHDLRSDSGGDDRADMPSGGDDRAEEDEEMNEEEEDTLLLRRQLFALEKY